MLVTKSEYLVILSNGEQRKIIAESVSEVCKELETESVKIVSIVKDHIVEQYNVPDKMLVTAAVNSLAAYECGCRAYPEIPVLVEAGDTLAITAVEVPGWKFIGWSKDEEILSKEKQALVTVPASNNGNVTYSALFVED